VSSRPSKAEREAARARKQRARERYVQRTYGITPEQYAVLLAYQGGRCWGCGRATGASKALAVDHNHRTGEVRMCLCGPCNQIAVGRIARDDPAALLRLALALIDPPSRRAWAGIVELADGTSASLEYGWGDPETRDMLDRL
jgi:hypothetical protein